LSPCCPTDDPLAAKLELPYTCEKKHLANHTSNVARKVHIMQEDEAVWHGY
jgi:hypothetical protein